MSAAKETVQQLTVTERAKKALTIKQTEAELKKLAVKNKDVTEIKDADDYQLVKSAHLELGKVRVSIEKAGKSARDDANKFSKAVIEEERRLVGIIKPEEDRLKALRQAVDDAEEREREEARKAEEARITAITDRINAIKAQTEGLISASCDTILERLEQVRDIQLTDEFFGEFVEQATEAHSVVVNLLENAFAEREAFEAQQAEQQRIAEEQAKQQAELDRQAEEQREKQEAEQRRIDEEKARLKQEQDELERKQREEAERKAREQREAEEAERKAAEEEAQRQRQEALRPEKDRLIEWVKKITTAKPIRLKNKELAGIQDTVCKDVAAMVSEVVEQIEAL